MKKPIFIASLLFTASMLSSSYAADAVVTEASKKVDCC